MSTEDQIRKILGLEVNPNGVPDYFLIRNQRGVVTEGIYFVFEVMELAEMFEAGREKALRGLVKEMKKKLVQVNLEPLMTVDMVSEGVIDRCLAECLEEPADQPNMS